MENEFCPTIKMEGIARKSGAFHILQFIKKGNSAGMSLLELSQITQELNPDAPVIVKMNAPEIESFRIRREETIRSYMCHCRRMLGT